MVIFHFNICIFYFIFYSCFLFKILSVCNFGYTGANCTQIVDVCATNPCKNGVCTQSKC